MGKNPFADTIFNVNAGHLYICRDIRDRGHTLTTTQVTTHLETDNHDHMDTHTHAQMQT